MPPVPAGEDYPSAVAGLSDLAVRERSLPIAVVGSGLGGDCVPSDSNHGLYYAAASAPAWEVRPCAHTHCLAEGQRRA